MILGHKNAVFEVRELGQDAFLEKHSLAGWLQIATEDLAATPRERIKREIESHFAEAVAANMDDGQTESSARDTALADLGDPDEAAKKFKKSHLTEAEAKWLRSMVQTAAGPLFSAPTLKYDAPFVAGSVAILYSMQWTGDITTLWLFLSLFISYAGLRLFPRVFYANISAGLFRKMTGLSGGLTVMACSLITALIPYQHVSALLRFINVVYWACLFGYFRNHGLRVWLKLRKRPDPWLNPPPQQPVSS
jgi:hypothetical protein